MNQHIVVIGSCAMDVTIVSDKRPIAGETVIGKGMYTSPGGKGANQAIAAAKLGAHVSIVGAIGKDAYGDMIEENFKKHHIDTTYLVRRDDVASGTAHIILAEEDNSIIVLLGANATIDRALIDEAEPALRQADLVIIQNEVPMDTICYVADWCEKAKIPLLLNPAPAANLPRDTIEKATYITPNEHELRYLYPDEEPEDVIRKGAGRLIVTVGKAGVTYSDGKELITVRGFSVEPVDTTGAGDTFNGAFATGIVKGMKLEEAIRYGNAAAALSITKLGAQQGMPTAEEVAAFIGKET